MGKNTSVVLGEAQEKFIRAQIEKGAYGSVSDVVRAGIAALKERDDAVERWLHEEVAPAYDAAMREPEQALEIDAVFDELLGRRGNAQ